MELRKRDATVEAPLPELGKRLLLHGARRGALLRTTKTGDVDNGNARTDDLSAAPVMDGEPVLAPDALTLLQVLGASTDLVGHRLPGKRGGERRLELLGERGQHLAQRPAEVLISGEAIHTREGRTDEDVPSVTVEEGDLSAGA